jgi:hypothetical protein
MARSRPPAGAGGAGAAAGAASRPAGSCNDWMYAMSCMSPSSLTRPWYVGMTG